MRPIALMILLTLAACAPATQPAPGYCPPPFQVGAGGFCENDQPEN
jgi:hypothetical protein